MNAIPDQSSSDDGFKPATQRRDVVEHHKVTEIEREKFARHLPQSAAIAALAIGFAVLPMSLRSDSLSLLAKALAEDNDGGGNEGGEDGGGGGDGNDAGGEDGGGEDSGGDDSGGNDAGGEDGGGEDSGGDDSGGEGSDGDNGGGNSHTSGDVSADGDDESGEGTTVLPLPGFTPGW